MTGNVLQFSLLGVTGRRKVSTPSQYRKEFSERVKAARITSRKTQSQIADELGVKLNTYQTWEGRTLMPHQHLIPFCYATRSDAYFLLTGVPFSLGQAVPPDPRRVA